MKRGGGPVRYTGWTVPSYNQSQQQYGYTGGPQQGAYDMNNYPQQAPYTQQQGGYSYQGQPQTQYSSPPPAANAAYYDATQTEAGQCRDRYFMVEANLFSWISTPDLSSSSRESVNTLMGMKRRIISLWRVNNWLFNI